MKPRQKNVVHEGVHEMRIVSKCEKMPNLTDGKMN